MTNRAEQEVLFANEAFYRAFGDRDFRAMDALWSRDFAVACVHPGWGALVGRQAVLESWASLLANPRSPTPACRAPRAFLCADAAFVICFEELEGNFLLATNVFVREKGAWRMVHHQSGPTADRPAPESTAPERGPVH
jgi:SnoaL-like domain